LNSFIDLVSLERLAIFSGFFRPNHVYPSKDKEALLSQWAAEVVLEGSSVDMKKHAFDCASLPANVKLIGQIGGCGRCRKNWAVAKRAVHHGLKGSINI
jgi:hypothetical protein